MAGQSGSGLLPKPHSLDSEIQHTAKRLCDTRGRYKPVSKPFSSHMQTQSVEMLPPAPLQFLGSMCKNAVVMFRNRSCPTSKPALAPQVRPLVPEEPTWLTAPSLAEMVICSDTLKLLTYAHTTNTRHGWQDVHHQKCEQWHRHLPQHPGKMTRLGAVGGRRAALGKLS